MVSVNLADEVASTAATASPASSETSLVGTWRRRGRRGTRVERRRGKKREREKKKEEVEVSDRKRKKLAAAAAARLLGFRFCRCDSASSETDFCDSLRLVTSESSNARLRQDWIERSALAKSSIRGEKDPGRPLFFSSPTFLQRTLALSSLNLLERFFSRTLAPEAAAGASPVTMIRSAGGEPGESSTSAAAARATMGEERRSGTAAAAATRDVVDVDDVDALAVETGAQRARSMAADIF